jgi:O-antigen/teichoic acid export membrane protein
VVTLVATIWLLSAGAGVAGVFLGQAAGSGVGLVIALMASRRSFGGRFDQAWLRTLLGFAGPLVPASVGVLIALYVDRLVIAALLTLEDVAHFAIGHRLASIVAIAMTAIQLALTPLIYATYRRHDAPLQIARAFQLIVVGALGLWALTSLAAPELVAVVATGAYEPAAAVVPLLAPAIILSGLMVFAPGLAIAKRTNVIALISLFGAVLNLALSAALVTVLGIMGAAIATVASAATVFAVSMRFSQATYPIPYDLRAAAAATTVVAVAVLISGVPAGSPVSVVWRVVLGIAVLGILFMMTVRRGPVRLDWSPTT